MPRKKNSRNDRLTTGPVAGELIAEHQERERSGQGRSFKIPSVQRRVMPTLIAQEIIGVSPMSAPSPAIGQLRTRYGTSTLKDQ